MKVRCVNSHGCYVSLEVGVVYTVLEELIYPDDTYYILAIGNGIKVSHKRFISLSYERNELIDSILE